ncbi:hypothetical protein [Marinomonas phage CPP1m]|uniref:Uncharacterized protein n=2 Tax=Murciavirus CPP1m TaxID=2733327 RepID=A0A1W5SA98_9CAUD|nr:hypothetical protein HOR72_gp14 [Marinomonas phage CPP1m]ARB11233.1 hypothetical protein [Marinomonas phage CPP1m]ARB11283.1 hypothetical protein [Marinomonas phage CPG1g]
MSKVDEKMKRNKVKHDEVALDGKRTRRKERSLKRNLKRSGTTSRKVLDDQGIE